MAEATPFRTWNGRDSFEFVDGVSLHAIGGEQVHGVVCGMANWALARGGRYSMVVGS